MSSATILNYSRITERRSDADDKMRGVCLSVCVSKKGFVARVLVDDFNRLVEEGFNF